jgi:hypothetical protein
MVMRHWLGRAVLVGSVGMQCVVACSDDNSHGAAPPAGNNAGDGSSEGGAPAGGEPGQAGSKNGGGSGTALGGAPGDAGASQQLGGSSPQAGAGGRDPVPLGGGGAVGEGGETGEPEPGPPDLITDMGGPWPDSFTGACANAKRAIVCPQLGDPFFGQDGTYRLNVPSYKTSSTTLTDSITGLVWQLSLDATPRTQAQAAAYCDALTLAGKDDWRLPTRLEYVSVLDEGASNGSCMPPTVPHEVLGNTWTASPTATTPGQFFVLNEQYGAWNLGAEDTTSLARCVRGPALSGARSSASDVVQDAMTGLIWQASSLDDTLLTWGDALAYCEGLVHAGKDDWRLPSIKELATLVDETATVAPVLYADLGGGAAQYWSSTPAPNIGGGESFAFAVETSFGISPSFKVTEVAAAARCVRSAD